VKDGEQVIVEGQMRLVDGARVDIVPPAAKQNDEKKNTSDAGETSGAPKAETHP
jgi:hypothetical protein